MARPKKVKSTKKLPQPTQVLSLSDWIGQQANKDMLRFITCGSVDDGKSTLIGRLLWETQQIYDDQFEAIEVASKRHGTQGDRIDLALLVDGLAAEREQGITIDVAYRYFSTPNRKFIVADTPGHEQYTRNMITGASTADVAVILVDARRGLLTQTRRHAYLTSLMGVRHVVLAVNKMDLVNYDIKIFDAIVEDLKKFAISLSFVSISAIPMSALKGENLLARSHHMSWYSGPTLLSYLETVPTADKPTGSFAFPVQRVNRPNSEFRGYSGTVASGNIEVGDKIRVTTSGQTSTIKCLVTYDGEIQKVSSGDAVTIVLDSEVDASRGDIFSAEKVPLTTTDQFEATIIWMHEDIGMASRKYRIKHANQWLNAEITMIKHRVNPNTLAHEPCRQISLNDILVCNLSLERPVVHESYQNSIIFGGFILVELLTNVTLACGLINHSLRRADHIHRQSLSINRQDREQLNGHKGKVIWFTGLSGAGKTTLANALEVKLHALGRRTYLLDGDNIRLGLNKDLGFTEIDRVENIRRVAEVAKLFMDAGLIVITAFISPFRAEREMARQLIGEDDFVEVFINTPLEVCQQRDPKGLYKKARNGIIPNMTGIQSRYETPMRPTVTIDASSISVEAAVIELLTLI